MRENLSFGFASVQGSTQPAELPRLDRILKFCLKQIPVVKLEMFPKDMDAPAIAKLA